MGIKQNFPIWERVFPQSIERLGKPQEIAAAVTFLASPLWAYTIGACRRVDGGTSWAM